jgi:hypothetical protein
VISTSLLAIVMVMQMVERVEQMNGGLNCLVYQLSTCFSVRILDLVKLQQNNIIEKILYNIKY